MTPASLLIFTFRAHNMLAVSPMLAQSAGGLKESFQYVVYILMMIGLVWGVIKCISGFASMRGGGGMDGMMEIVGGIGIAAAPIIMNAVFSKLCPAVGEMNPTAIQ